MTGRVRAYNRPYQVRGRWYAPREEPTYDRVGVASWYSYESPNRTTADGEPFDVRLATAAHTTLPIPSWLEVTNLDNGRSERVRLNDRGPFRADRIIDLSRGAAEQLGFLQQGTARVRVRYLGPATPLGGAEPMWAIRAPSRRPPAMASQRYAALDTLAPRRQAFEDPAAEVAEDDVQDIPPPAGADIAMRSDGPPPRPGLQDNRGEDAEGDVGGGYEVQAAAFADRGNAERAAARLAQAGVASIRPLQHGEVMLYRVVVGPWAEAGLAVAARSRAAALGFTDAKIVSR